MQNSRDTDSIRRYIKRQYNLPDEQIETMIPLFLATLAEHLKTLDQACTANDPAALGQVGHTIKGALLNLGLHQAAQIALTIEKRGKAADDTADYQALAAELKNTLAGYLD
jgi:HPt (histidine-containing phosphotransfer) domain-containing protein